MKPDKSLERRAMAFAHRFFNSLRPRGMDQDRQHLAGLVIRFALSESRRAYRKGWNEALGEVSIEMCHSHCKCEEILLEKIIALRRK